MIDVHIVHLLVELKSKIRKKSVCKFKRTAE